MTLIGDTLFAGDSITVGLPPFVDVAGVKSTAAKGGQSSAALLAMMRAEESKGTLDRVKNLVVLAGTNDIGSSLAPEAIFGNLQAIYKMGKAHGVRVFALTIPPAKGATAWAGRDDFVDSRRRSVNRLIMTSVLPDRVTDLDTLMGTSPTSGVLAPQFDSGDHLHPRKDKMGAVLNRDFVAAATAPTSPGISPLAPSSPPAGAPRQWGVGSAVLATGAGYGIWRGWKWWRGRS